MELLKYNFHDRQLHSLNPIRREWHKARHNKVASLVTKYYDRGDIVDLGCGNCNWNENTRLPVIGVDQNTSTLEYTKSKGRIRLGLSTSIDNTGLLDNSIPLVVCTETLEHIENYQNVISEIKRILSDGGYLITSVPYDTPFSTWNILFKLLCLYEGNIRGDVLYKMECGHINHFSPKKFKNLFLNQGLKLIELHNMAYMTIFLVAQKPPKQELS
jgi:2-polyprenyl-3-methyl-5-hydroxy-6-metoxy-1,4-benzoquinol methylase